ncbi:MAG: hypothetical protein BWY75_02540 [bacterium ADurb.Bin425]|nr:MAG: hypothetical protein BWY75_02540 [bacterium ADurb.Bin425]
MTIDKTGSDQAATSIIYGGISGQLKLGFDLGALAKGHNPAAEAS